MAVKYLSNIVKDLQVGITNYSENKGSSLYVVGNVGVGTNDATAEVGISNTSILAVGILTAYKIYSSVYGEFTGAFSGGTVDSQSLNVSGISTLGTVKVSDGIVTATTGVVTYYGDGQYLTGIDVENPSQLNVAGVSTFSGNIDANADLDVDGKTSLDDLVVTGVSTFNNTVTLSALLDCNGGADIDTLTAATARISDLTDTRIVIAGSNGELEDSAQLRYVSSTLTVGTNLDVDGHTELDDVNVGGAITATTFTGNLSGNVTGLVLTPGQPNITSVGTLTGLTVSGDIDVDGHAELDDVNVSGASTFVGPVDMNFGLDISGTYLNVTSGLIANSARIADLTDTRIVIAGTSGEIEDTSKLTFDGTTLAVDGDATFTGNVSIAGTLTKEDVTNIDSVGLVTARTGVRITSGGLVVSSGVSTFTDAIDANGGLDVSGGTGLTASSIKVSSLADNKIVVSGANGELINDTELSYDRTGNALTLTGNLFLPNDGNHAGIGTAVKLGPNASSTALSVWAGAEKSGVRIWASNTSYDNELAIPLQVSNTLGTEYFRVANTGNVGIGSVIPSEKLDVDGNIKVSGDINANGDIIGDTATNISGINSVTAVTYYGDGSGLTNLSSSGLWVPNSAGIHTTSDVGIGTTNPSAAVTVDNTAKLAVGIVSAYQLYGDGKGLTDVSWGSSPSGGSSFITQGSQTAVGGDAGDWQVIAGYWAGCCANSNTRNNVILGQSAGRKLVDGDRNVFVGDDVGCGLTTGMRNVYMGSSTAQDSVSGDYNIGLGYKTLRTSTGSCNVAIGFCAADGNTSGENNVIIGKNANSDVGAGGNDNVWVGTDSGGYASGSCNTFVGAQSGYGVYNGTFNIGLGYEAGRSLIQQTAHHNISIGTKAGLNGTTGSCNVFLGTCAGRSVSTGQLNLFAGYKAGDAVTVGTRNVYLGNCAGAGSTDGHRNIAIGNFSGWLNTTGCCNVYIGSCAGTYNCTGSNNIAIGRCSGFAAHSTSNNTFIGDSSGSKLTIGEGNVFLGTNTGLEATNAGCNVFIGNNAGQGNTNVPILGGCNIAVGAFAGYNIKGGDDNVFLGTRAGKSSDDSNRNVFLGYYAGSLNGGHCNVFIGPFAGNTNTIGVSNVAIGPDVCLPSATGDRQLAIGSGSSNWIDGDSSYNVTLAGIVTAHATTGVLCATQFRGDGSCLTGAGGENLIEGITIHDDGTIVGTAATVNLLNFAGNGVTATVSGSDATITIPGFSPDAQENLYAGTDAGKCSGSDNCYNVAIGYHAGCEIGNGGSAQGDENVFIGKNSGRLNSDGLTNTFLGSNSGCRNSSGHDNVAIGNKALSNVQTGNANVAVGKNAGGSTTGYCNTFLGYYAGRNNTSGCCNIAIGRAVCLPSATTNNQFAIGSGTCHWITGDANFNVGIGTNRHDTVVGSAVTAKLSVGIVSTYKLYADQVDIEGGQIDGTNIGFFHRANANFNYVDIAYDVDIDDTTQSTSTTTGALKVDGGVGIVKNLNVGGDTNVTGSLTATSFSGDGTNLVGLAKSTVLEDAGIHTSGTTTLNHFVVTGISTFGNNIAVTGTASASDFNSTSDIRLKTNIKRIEDPLDKVIRIEGVTFDWKEWNRPALGVIADQVEEVIPELVQGTDPKTVNYNGLIGLLIEAVKEQQTQIDDLKSRLSKLE